MLYTLNRKDDVLTLLDINEDGDIVKTGSVFENNRALLPLHKEKDTGWLRSWWKRRAVPISQDHIKVFLEKNGYSCPESYLKKNLGLSLTDYYWINPVGSNLKWKDVNLFDNEFIHNLLLDEPDNNEASDIPHYTPNGTLQGTLEKSWSIINGERCLIKGNRNSSSAESINEVLASLFHQKQGFNNYTDYKLLKINGKSYDYGCYSKLFTSQDQELISAYDVLESDKLPNSVSYFEQFIQICANHGLDEESSRAQLDYMILSDFILSGTDRHLSNIAVLRDAKTLKFTSLAPIFDSGKAMFCHEDFIPNSYEGLLDIETTSFRKNELGMLALIRNREEIIDFDKLPTVEEIRSLYSMDSKFPEDRLSKICNAYEMKIELAKRFVKGENLNNP